MSHSRNIMSIQHVLAGVQVNLMGSWCFRLSVVRTLGCQASHPEPRELSVCVSWVTLCLTDRISPLNTHKKVRSISVLDGGKLFVSTNVSENRGSDMDYGYTNYKVISQYVWFKESNLSFHSKNTLQLFNSHFLYLFFINDTFLP